MVGCYSFSATPILAEASWLSLIPRLLSHIGTRWITPTLTSLPSPPILSTLSIQHITPFLICLLSPDDNNITIFFWPFSWTMAFYPHHLQDLRRTFSYNIKSHIIYNIILTIAMAGPADDLLVGPRHAEQRCDHTRTSLGHHAGENWLGLWARRKDDQI